MKASKIALYAVLVFVVGVGGVLAGDFLRRTLSRSSVPVMEEPHSLLRLGEEFPDVAVSLADGSSPGTRSLVEDGGVVLFLDLGCPPCEDMARKWQDLIDAGETPIPVVAVTNNDQEAIEWFRGDHGITFPIAQDTRQVFRYEYEVDRFPLEVVVDRGGRIRGLSYDSAGPVDGGAVAGRIRGNGE